VATRAVARAGARGPSGRASIVAAPSIAAIVTLLAGCAASPADQSTTPATATETPQAEASLESILLPVITEQMEQMQVPGLVAIVETRDGDSYEVALGFADADAERAMELTDHLRIGSITKTLTATVILQLSEEGALALDDPLAPYFPGVDTNGATIRQALNMTSGIPGYTGDSFMQGQAADPQRVWTPDEIIAIVAGRPPAFAAGEAWEY
jgi:D-alanyl-D-alanine carboxypeptidase